MNRDSVIIANDFTINVLGNESMVTSETMEDILIINEFGSDILKLILSKDKMKVGEIIDSFEETYSSESLEEDIVEFLDAMLENGVIKS